MALLPSVARLQLEMVKGNQNMMKSLHIRQVPLSLLREKGCMRMWIASLTSSEIQLLRHMCLSSQCDDRAPMHAELEQKQ